MGILEMKNYSVEEAIVIMGVCRTVCYREMKEGRLKYIKCGKRTLIPAQAIIDWTALLSNLSPAGSRLIGARPLSLSIFQALSESPIMLQMKGK